MVASGSQDRCARLWSVATGKRIGPSLSDQSFVRAIAFHPDNRRFLTGGYDRVSARIWEIAPPLEGDPATISFHLSVSLGMRLDESGDFYVLDADEWLRRRAELKANQQKDVR
jgi:WD40 repeat protein